MTFNVVAVAGRIAIGPFADPIAESGLNPGNPYATFQAVLPAEPAAQLKSIAEDEVGLAVKEVGKGHGRRGLRHVHVPCGSNK